MKGSEAKMIGFMEGADKRYVIPVYQRKYDSSHLGPQPKRARKVHNLTGVKKAIVST